MWPTQLLNNPLQVFSIIGSGGKTTFIKYLACQFQRSGHTVITTTSTHILPPHHIPVLDDPDMNLLSQSLQTHPHVCVGTRTPEGKLTAPSRSISEMRTVADVVLIEADGSKRLPLKAHATWEPCIPLGTQHTILVLGVRGFGCPIQEQVHRPEIFCAITQALPHHKVTPFHVAQVVTHEHLVTHGDTILINQCDTPERLNQARIFAESLKMLWPHTEDLPTIVAANIHTEHFIELS